MISNACHTHRDFATVSFQLAIAGLLTCALPVAGNQQASAQILDQSAVLARQSWWDNRDFDWFKARIPFFESPDTAIDATYYYRWEILTKHLTYGSPETGYTFTEFIDRPFWSGRYGAISCPLGHQFAELRWLDDRDIIDDFARYWFETPGAEPRSYSNWYSSAVWGVYKVLGDTTFLRNVLPYMKQQYAGWMAERWDTTQRMFRWDGLHDGMERNINSRQTDDIDEGAEGYRPTLNSYMYGEALAIAHASSVLGDRAAARDFSGRANELQQRVERELWDEKREFFLHQFAHEEKDGVRALSRTYETGKFAGDPHGRELLGYVPWQFDLPEPGKGYERAWRFLMDTAYFLSPYGPTTTERHDPQFYVSPTCCWWSGNSWPYATTQTLIAMANLLDDYQQDVVTRADWMKLFDIYTRTQRKNGRPYVAEGANPDNGSWAGFDTYYHSEHYFHSGYVDLVVTGVVGLRPRTDDTVEVQPLAPESWNYFALDDVRYHGHRLSILWDRDGSRYKRGKGLILIADGRTIATTPHLQRISAPIGAPVVARRASRMVNVAVNNGRGAYPWVRASFSAPENPAFYVVDGNYWYHQSPPNRWTTIGSPHARDTISVDFGAEREVEQIKLYFLDDGDGAPVQAPAKYSVQTWNGRKWVDADVRGRTPPEAAGHRANVVTLVPRTTSRVRVVLEPRPHAAVGLTELEVWGSNPLPLSSAREVSHDVAFNGTGQGYPKASASFTSRNDRVGEINDMQFAFTRYSANRWTAYGSPNASDWVEINFGTARVVRSLELYLWSDNGGVKPPRHYTVQYWVRGAWRDARVLSRFPERPMASAVNVVKVQPLSTMRVRVTFTHDLPAFTGVTELVIPDR
jgi:mannosylglycerate hydrolase MGH1-like protein/glycosyl hydrolase family 65/F5/8 type C domain-containing protein